MDDLSYIGGQGGHFSPAEQQQQQQQYHQQQPQHNHHDGVDSLLLSAQLDLNYLPQHHHQQHQHHFEQQQQHLHPPLPQLPAAPSPAQQQQQHKYFDGGSHITSSSSNQALEFALGTEALESSSHSRAVSHPQPHHPHHQSSPWVDNVGRFASPQLNRAFSFAHSAPVQLAAPLPINASRSPAWPAPVPLAIMMATVANEPPSAAAGSSSSNGGEKSKGARGGKRPQNSNKRKQQPSDAADAAQREEEAASASPASPDAAGSSTARKQNSACDACRARKVACKKIAGATRCVHCESKDVECTRRHSELVASGAGPQRAVKKRNISQSSSGSLDALLQFVLQGGARYEVDDGLPSSTALVAAEARLANAQVRAEFSRDLIETFLSIVHPRLPVIEMETFRARFYNQHSELGPPPLTHIAVMLAWGARFSESPILVADRAEAAKALSADQRVKREAALPMRSSGESDASNDSAKPAALSAVGASSIADMLLVKAQEVMTRHQAHREPTLDNIRACILITPILMKQVPFVRHGAGLVNAPLSDQRTTRLVTDAFWANAAVDHLYTLGIHLQKQAESGQTSPDHMLCWWLCVSISSHLSARDRCRSRICADDYTLQRGKPPADALTLNGPWNDVPTRVQLYRDAVQQMADIHNQFYPLLWAPVYSEQGVPARNFEQLLDAADAWRVHLPARGAPSTQWPSDWTFAKASTHATEDISFHLFYVLMWQALREQGMRELLPAHLKRGTPEAEEAYPLERAKALQTRIQDEALSAALRIASLCQVLTTHGYLRLDAGVMKCAFFEAGLCLTEFCRREVVSIVHGLRQCGLAFPECWEQADMLESMAAEYMSPGFPRISALLQPPPATPSSMASRTDDRSATHAGMASFSSVPMEPPHLQRQDHVPALYAEYHAPGQRLSRTAQHDAPQAHPTTQRHDSSVRSDQASSSRSS